MNENAGEMRMQEDIFIKSSTQSVELTTEDGLPAPLSTRITEAHEHITHLNKMCI